MGIVKNCLIWCRKKKGVNYKIVRLCSSYRVNFRDLEKMERRDKVGNYEVFYKVKNGLSRNNNERKAQRYSGVRRVRKPRETTGKFNNLGRNN